MKNVQFLVFFSRLGPFPQVFGQVKEWFMLELNKIITMSHAVAYPIVFVLFFDQSCQGRVFKVIKKIFSSVFSRLNAFPQVFRQVK